MGKKDDPPKNDFTFRFRCRKAEVEEFRRLAEAEGFGGNASAWALWHLRRIVKEHKRDSK